MEVLERQQIKNYTLGSDVEYFLQDKNTEAIVTAEGKIKGTKHEPFRFDAENKYFATSLDCVLAEGNIPPCKTPGEFYLAIQKLLRYINGTIPNHLEAIAIPAARMAEEELVSDTAKEYGCMPSINCWTLAEIRPIPSGDNCRAAGFHIHIGYDEPNSEMNLQLIKAMDLFLGIPSVLIEPENERKSVGYGCAGNFRECHYGREIKNTYSLN